jgi:uncharacterized Tic20 family protein
MSTGDANPSEPSGYRPPGPEGAAGEKPAADSAPPPQWQAAGEQQQYQPPGPGYPPPGQTYQPPGPGYPPPGGAYPPPGPGYPPPGQGSQQAPYQGGYQVSPGGALSPQDERTWAMAAHLSSIIGMIFGLSFVGPLVVMLVQGPKSALVRANAVEALNFNLSILIYFVGSILLTFILIGIPMLFAVGIVWLVFTIIASVKTSNGEAYRYPLTIRMVT